MPNTKTATQARTQGSARRPTWSRTPAGSSVAPSRGSTAMSSAHETTANARLATMTERQPSAEASIFPAEVASTIATENAP